MFSGREKCRRSFSCIDFYWIKLGRIILSFTFLRIATEISATKLGVCTSRLLLSPQPLSSRPKLGP